jgi:hypothetical protein
MATLDLSEDELNLLVTTIGLAMNVMHDNSTAFEQLTKLQRKVLSARSARTTTAE